MTRQQIDATLDAIAILESHVDAAGRWMELSSTAKDVRVSAWQRLKSDVRIALTGAAS